MTRREECERCAHRLRCSAGAVTPAPDYGECGHYEGCMTFDEGPEEQLTRRDIVRILRARFADMARNSAGRLPSWLLVDEAAADMLIADEKALETTR